MTIAPAFLFLAPMPPHRKLRARMNAMRGMAEAKVMTTTSLCLSFANARLMYCSGMSGLSL